LKLFKFQRRKQEKKEKGKKKKKEKDRKTKNQKKKPNKLAKKLYQLEPDLLEKPALDLLECSQNCTKPKHIRFLPWSFVAATPMGCGPTR
jgi:hypothetical protein